MAKVTNRGREVPSWTGGGTISLERSRLGWVDVLGIVLAALVADAVVMVVVGGALPVNQHLCDTYSNCVSDPHLDARDAVARLLIFFAWVALSVVVVFWRYRRALRALIVVQVLALAFVALTCLTEIHQANQRLKDGHVAIGLAATHLSP